MSKIKEKERGRPPKPGGLAWIKKYGSQDIQKISLRILKRFFLKCRFRYRKIF